MDEIINALSTKVGIILGAAATIGTLVVRQLLSNWSHRRRKDLERREEQKQQESEKEEKRLNSVSQTAQYKDKISKEVGQFRILDMVQSIDLQQTYVQLKVTEDEPLLYTRISDSAERASGQQHDVTSLNSNDKKSVCVHQ